MHNFQETLIIFHEIWSTVHSSGQNKMMMIEERSWENSVFSGQRLNDECTDEDATSRVLASTDTGFGTLGGDGVGGGESWGK